MDISKSIHACKKRKDAEQSAAQVALSALMGSPLPESEAMAIDADVTRMVSEARQASQTPVALKGATGILPTTWERLA